MLVFYINFIFTIFLGYYCISNSSTSAPTDSITGNVCPRGGYCPTGSKASVACPAGTFNNQTGSRDTSSCFPCTPGFYCIDTNAPQPTGPCSAGYYCLSGSMSPYQYSSYPGTYSLEGFSSPTPCSPGTYNDAYNASFCPPTPAGYYSANQSTIIYTPCPLGYYCPIGSFSPIPCPLGTIGTETMMANLTQCTICPAGSYCQTNGQSVPTGLCIIY